MSKFIVPKIAVLFLALAWPALHFVAWSAETFSAGAAEVDITPDPKMTNWIGHKPYDAVLDPIFARALVLADESNKIVLLCWDLVDARETAVATIRRKIAREIRVPVSNILVHASHNHSAPWSPPYEAPLLKEEQATLLPVTKDPTYQAWAERLMELSVKVAQQADAARRPATLEISRAYVGEVIFNRRPRKPDGTVEMIYEPRDPYALPDGLRFGPMDPTLSVVLMRDSRKQTIATLFHLPCHPVAIYPSYKGISADWPGPVADQIQSVLGGVAIFLQGCAGDIVPARRGLAARDKMSRLIAERALASAKQSHPLPVARLRSVTANVTLPLTEAARRDIGRPTLTSEVQVITCGSLALVALPGEPLIDLAITIQQRSPYPHTLVLGYANGYGIQYVGMPGEKARGGYEMGVAGAGTDECGGILVETAVRLLQEQHQAKP